MFVLFFLFIPNQTQHSHQYPITYNFVTTWPTVIPCLRAASLWTISTAERPRSNRDSCNSRAIS